MCFVKTPQLPSPPAAIPRLPDAGVRLARSDAIRSRRASAGRASTILTGASGVSGAASTTFNTLLGS